MPKIRLVNSETMILRTVRGVRIILNSPHTLRFVAAPDMRDSGNAYVHLLRLDESPDARSLDHESHVLSVWWGRADIAMDLCARLMSVLASKASDTVDVGEIEAACVAAARRPQRDLDEDLRTGRDAPSTEADGTAQQDLATYATETRALSTSLREAIETVAADLATYSASVPITAHAATLRQVITYTADGYEVIAKALDDIANP